MNFNKQFCLLHNYVLLLIHINGFMIRFNIYKHINMQIFENLNVKLFKNSIVITLKK